MGTAALYRLDPREELDFLLDKSLFCLARATGSAEPALDELVHGLGAAGASAAAWKRHPLFRLFDQDPFTRRARSWHSGDAVAMDFIFRGLPHRQRRLTTRVGQAIFEYTAELSDFARGIRARRDGIAKAIDAAIARVQAPRILSVGCGHLRELSLSSAGETKLGAMYALDADPLALQMVREEHTHVRALETVHATVSDLLKATVTYRGLDLIYAANLFESLAEPVARALLARLVEMLAPGGTLLVANSIPTIPSLGLLDGVMAWPIVWRTEEQLARLVDGTRADRIEYLTTYADADETSAYLDIVRR